MKLGQTSQTTHIQMTISITTMALPMTIHMAGVLKILNLLLVEYFTLLFTIYSRTNVFFSLGIEDLMLMNLVTLLMIFIRQTQLGLSWEQEEIGMPENVQDIGINFEAHATSLQDLPNSEETRLVSCAENTDTKLRYVKYSIPTIIGIISLKINVNHLLHKSLCN